MTLGVNSMALTSYMRAHSNGRGGPWSSSVHAPFILA